MKTPDKPPNVSGIMKYPMSKLVTFPVCYFSARQILSKTGWSLRLFDITPDRTYRNLSWFPIWCTKILIYLHI